MASTDRTSEGGREDRAKSKYHFLPPPCQAVTSHSSIPAQEVLLLSGPSPQPQLLLLPLRAQRSFPPRLGRGTSHPLLATFLCKQSFPLNAPQLSPLFPAIALIRDGVVRKTEFVCVQMYMLSESNLLTMYF